jgi:hypothetical protein
MRREHAVISQQVEGRARARPTSRATPADLATSASRRRPAGARARTATGRASFPSTAPGPAGGARGSDRDARGPRGRAQAAPHWRAAQSPPGGHTAACARPPPSRWTLTEASREVRLPAACPRARP